MLFVQYTSQPSLSLWAGGQLLLKYPRAGLLGYGGMDDLGRCGHIPKPQLKHRHCGPAARGQITGAHTWSAQAARKTWSSLVTHFSTITAGTGFCPGRNTDPSTDPTRKDARAEVTALDKAHVLTGDLEGTWGEVESQLARSSRDLLVGSAQDHCGMEV